MNRAALCLLAAAACSSVPPLADAGAPDGGFVCGGVVPTTALSIGECSPPSPDSFCFAPNPSPI